MKTCRWAMLSVLAVLLLLVCLPLSAQEITAVKQGDEVRIYDVEKLVARGTFRRIDEGFFLVSSTVDGQDVRIPRGEAWLVEVRQVKRHPLLGLGIGLALGAVVGFGVVETAEKGVFPCFLDGVECEADDSSGPVIGAALVGGALGALAGFAIKTSKWRAVQVPAQPSFRLSQDGRIGLRFSLPTRR